jgi:hypothetical protein
MEPSRLDRSHRIHPSDSGRSLWYQNYLSLQHGKLANHASIFFLIFYRTDPSSESPKIWTKDVLCIAQGSLELVTGLRTIFTSWRKDRNSVVPWGEILFPRIAFHKICWDRSFSENHFLTSFFIAWVSNWRFNLESSWQIFRCQICSKGLHFTSSFDFFRNRQEWNLIIFFAWVLSIKLCIFNFQPANLFSNLIPACRTWNPKNVKKEKIFFRCPSLFPAFWRNSDPFNVILLPR